MSKFTRDNYGYTLLEIVLALSILSVGIVGLFSLFTSTETEKQEQLTRMKIMDIEEAIDAFFEKNSYIPCPANNSGLAVPSTKGQSVTQSATTFKCSNALGDGTPGVIPFATLNLSEDYLYDGWGHKFTYKIATGLGAASTFTSYRGDINIVDETGTTQTFIDRKYPNDFGAAYVLISHGGDGRGAFVRGTTNTQNATNNTKLDYKNTLITSSNAIYIYSPSPSRLGDMVFFKTREKFTDISTVFIKSPIKIPEQTCSNINYISNYILKSTETASTTLQKNTVFSNSWLTTYGNLFIDRTREMNTLCKQQTQARTVNPVCDFPNDLKNTLVVWLDANDPNGTSLTVAQKGKYNPLAPDAIGDGLSTSTWVNKAGTGDFTAPQSPIDNRPQYRHASPFASYQNSTGTLVTRHSFSFFGGTYATSDFFSANLSTVFPTTFTSDYSIFVVATIDIAGLYNQNRQPISVFSVTSPTVPTAQASELHIGWGQHYSQTTTPTLSGNPAYSFLGVNKDIAIPSGDFNAGSNPTIFNYQLKGISGIINETVWPYYYRFLKVLTKDGRSYLAAFKDTGYNFNAANAKIYIGADYTAAQVVAPQTTAITPVVSPGTTPAPAGAFRGHVGEVLVFNRYLTSDERKIIESYLTRKWFTGECM